MPYELKPGDGAFYGPKIDFDVADSIGRKLAARHHPARLRRARSGSTSSYVGEDNAEHRPVVIHRAVSGSFERFIAILIEHFAGAFPVWLAPEQVRVLPISDAQAEAAATVDRAARGGRHPGAPRRPERDAELPDPRGRGAEGALHGGGRAARGRERQPWRSGCAGRGTSRR